MTEMDEYIEVIRLKKQQLFELRFNHEEKVEEKKKNLKIHSPLHEI